MIANLAAEPCIEPVSGDLAAALARLGIDVPRPAADEPERDSPPPRKRPTRPRRDAHVFPSASAAGIAAATAPFRATARTRRPPIRHHRGASSPRPRAPHRLAKAADADPPLEVASQEVIRHRRDSNPRALRSLGAPVVGRSRERGRSREFLRLCVLVRIRGSRRALRGGLLRANETPPTGIQPHARRTGTGPYGGRVVTRGVPVPEPRVAAVVECVVEERVVGKPWEGPIAPAPRGEAVRVPVRAGPWGGPRRAPRVVEGVGTTPEAAVDALRAAVRRASRGAAAAAAKLPPADVLFGFAPGRAARALAQLTMITGTPTRIPPGRVRPRAGAPRVEIKPLRW